jgi:Ni/Fe-hydrogenase subunit HybB-like protein
MAWYSADPAERYQFFVGRPEGPNAGVFWTMLFCNAVVIQLLWFKRIRRSIAALFVISIVVNVGMWCERFVIIVQSLQREFLPSKWESYSPTWVDAGIGVGTLGFFSLLFLTFLRLVPFVSATEMKELRREMAHPEPR